MRKGVCKGKDGRTINGKVIPKGCGKGGWLVGYDLCLECYKKLGHKTGIKKRYKPTGEKDLFDHIWETREHVSFLSGRSLDEFAKGIFYTHMFAHVLAKGQYPKLRLNEENIVLLTPDEHWLLDQGTCNQRAEYEAVNNCLFHRIKELKVRLLDKYICK